MLCNPIREVVAPFTYRFRNQIPPQTCATAYTSGPDSCLIGRLSGRWYLIDFARSRHTNPARIPVSPAGCWYYFIVLRHLLQNAATLFAKSDCQPPQRAGEMSG